MVDTWLYRRKGEQFNDNSGNILAGGAVYFYQAGTAVLQTTYSDENGAVPNSNPLLLNSDGRLTQAVFLGSAGDYKELVTDSNGKTIDPWPFDNIPAAVSTVSVQGFAAPLLTWKFITSASSPVSPAATDAGSAYECNTTSGNITINLPSAATVGNGKGFVFKKTAAPNAVTITPNGGNTIDGQSSATLQWIYQELEIVSDGANWIVVSQKTLPSKPQGRLTLTTGVSVIASDVTAATVVYYTACEGNVVPVYNGASFDPFTFTSDLSLTLAAASATANSIVDVFAFSNSGVLTLGYGPVWTTATAGSGARGTGAATTQLTRVGGLLVNAQAITLTNGATSYASQAANTCTYLGSLAVDSVAGQVSCHVSFGQSRKWGVWNAYNRRPIRLKAGDSNASWAYSTNTWRSSNNDSNNSLTVFAGLQEEAAMLAFTQLLTAASSGPGEIGIGVNSTSSPSGMLGAVSAAASTIAVSTQARHALAPDLGKDTISALEISTSGSVTFSGTSSLMMLTAEYMG